MNDSGKKRHNTVLICYSSDDVEEGHIQVNKVARNDLRVTLGDLILILHISEQIGMTVARHGRWAENQTIRRHWVD